MRPLSYDLDLAVEGSHHPVLYEEGPEPNFLEEPVSLQEKHELEAEYLEMHQDSDKEGTDSSPTPDEEVEDLLAKSSKCTFKWLCICSNLKKWCAMYSSWCKHTYITFNAFHCVLLYI